MVDLDNRSRPLGALRGTVIPAIVAATLETQFLFRPQLRSFPLENARMQRDQQLRDQGFARVPRPPHLPIECPKQNTPIH